MTDDLNEFKKEVGVKWVKADSGTSYLCPVASYERLDNPSEEQLKTICVDESQNPQND
ncbi:MAG: hypothetical protein QNJ97_12985 [Myxococcota bacterium]|nr:hypothetical protein [Myxococcota bacterium]